MKKISGLVGTGRTRGQRIVGVSSVMQKILVIPRQTYKAYLGLMAGSALGHIRDKSSSRFDCAGMVNGRHAVRFTLFSKRICAGDLHHPAMHGFESEFAFHLMNQGKSPTAIAGDQRSSRSPIFRPCASRTH
jgi:hypothetical protein